MCHYKHFTINEREFLLLGHTFGFSNRKISKISGRSPSSVSRESKRNSSDGIYSRFVATERYKENSLNCKPKCKTDNPEVKKRLSKKQQTTIYLLGRAQYCFKRTDNLCNCI